MSRTQVVVIGGGYAGVMAANRLTQRADVEVALVNARPQFVERIRLHQLVGGSDDAVVDYGSVLSPRVRLVVDEASAIDLHGRRVRLAAGGDLAYDYLVYAVGSRGAEPVVPGAAEHAYPLTTLEEAERLRPALAALPESASVAVVGGGPSGIETAAELAEQGRRVTLVCGTRLGPYLSPKSRRALGRRLATLGVTVVAGAGATVTAVAPDRVVLADGRQVPSTLTVWTVGFGVPDLARRSGFRTDEAGRLLTDETLTSVDDPRVVAAGDAAAPSALPFRMSCQAAGQLGSRAADTVLSRVAGEVPAPLALAFVGECLSLGRRTGLLQLAHRDDTAREAHLGGRVAAGIKELVCRSTIVQLRLEARHPGTFTLPTWAADGTRGARIETVRTTALVP